MSFMTHNQNKIRNIFVSKTKIAITSDCKLPALAETTTKKKQQKKANETIEDRRKTKLCDFQFAYHDIKKIAIFNQHIEKTIARVIHLI
jgi:hypothetical protein